MTPNSKIIDRVENGEQKGERQFSGHRAREILREGGSMSRIVKEVGVLYEIKRDTGYSS